MKDESVNPLMHDVQNRQTLFENLAANTSDHFGTLCI